MRSFIEIELAKNKWLEYYKNNPEDKTLPPRGDQLTDDWMGRRKALLTIKEETT